MKKLLCILLCLPLFAAYGCGTDDKDGGGKDGGRIADVIFWGAYNTEKVMADDPVPDEPKAADVVMQGIRGETESGQFIMTPDEGFPDFRSYNVTATALSGPDGAEIPAENIEIFMQHYIRTTNRSYPDTADKTAPMYLGWYPDALIPFDRAVSKRKNNITDGLNQGVWINVNIPADAEPGEYEGKLTVTMGEASKDIPVYLKVYDLDFPEELHTRYEFGLYYYMIGTGEGKKSSLELEEAYYWFLANKGLTPHAIPTGGYSTPAQYADYLVQFAASPKVTNYLLPYRGETNAVYGQLLDTNYLVQVLSAMGSKQRALDAEPGNTVNLFKKAGLRLGALTDEPQNAKDVERARECEKRVISAKDQAANSFPEYAADIQRIYSAVALTDISLNVGKGILNLVGDDTDGGLGTWSPTADRWDSRRTYEWQMTGGQWTTGTMKELVDYRRANSGKKNGEDFWWYICVEPRNPYPTHHLDDNLISSRLMGWMQYNLGISGFLHWCTNFYVKFDGVSQKPRDIWTVPAAYGSNNGDGYLLYPGSDYGINGPIGSIRLESVRESIEDYELMWMLGEKLAEINTQHGKNYDKDTLIAHFFDGVIIYDVIADVDRDNPSECSVRYYAKRGELLKLLDNMYNDTAAAITALDAVCA